MDPHPGSHTAAELDKNGKLLASITVVNDAEGLYKLKHWSQHFRSCRWAIEGADNSYIYPFVTYCIGQYEEVFVITPNLTSQYRRRGNNRKDDETDAINAARALLANPKLSTYRPFVAQRQVQQLSQQQRRLSKQLKANQMALQDIEDSKLTTSLEQVIRVLKKALTELSKQLEQLVKHYAKAL